MGTNGITKRERLLEAKGYRVVKDFNDPEKAHEYAENLRKKGYYAQVNEATTSAIGYYKWEVWAKKKGV